MPVYKDNTRGTWYVKCYYTDWNGKQRQKLKRGFALQRDAREWERSFIEQQAGTPEMTFGSLCDLYLKDCEKRNKQSSYRAKKSVCDTHLLPAWKDKPINGITPANVREWHCTVIASGIKPSTQNFVHRIFSAIMNYAVKYYGLQSNPCRAAGSIGKSNVHRLEFWTVDEFQKVLDTVEDLPIRTALLVLFYSGIRCGELLALQLKDFDSENKSISINKTYHKFDKTELITSPKTENSNRTVIISPFLVKAIQEYTEHIYDIQPDDRLFQTVTDRKLRYAMSKGSEDTGVKRLTIHGLRHSHVSLLIELGFTPHLIAERIGDTVQMVNSTYGHLYPNRHQEVADRLEKLVSK